MKALAMVAVLVLGSAGAARGQAVVPGGGSLAAWLGLAPGDRLTYETMEGERVCVEVGEAVSLGGRRYAPLVGMPWPGRASDAQFFLPLDGTLAIGIIPGPMLRPAEAFDWLIAPAAPRLVTPDVVVLPGALPADGWYAIGDPGAEPFALLYVWCRLCSDAGTYVWMERGRGITRIEERSYDGPVRLTLVDRGCADLRDAASARGGPAD